MGDSRLKALIQTSLENQDLEQAKMLIDQYKQENPYDMDIISMETIFELYSGNIDYALDHALEGVRRYPLNGDLYYNLGNIYEEKENWFWAWFAYGRAYVLYLYAKDEKVQQLGLIDLVQNCRALYEAGPKDNSHASCEDVARNRFGFFEGGFTSRRKEQILGKYFWESATEKRYAGIYNYNVLTKNLDNQLDISHFMGEFMKVTEGNEFWLDSDNVDILLPIAAENDGTIHLIVHGEEKYAVSQSCGKHFNYYRIPSASQIYSSEPVYYGRPIPLKHEPDKKKLVLNIFVDGLTQCILDGEDFRDIMPNTARFFGRGIVCTRAYSTAEWTYPSIATYVTGLDTTHHMLFHNMLEGRIPEETPTLAEYFQKKGYFTTIWNGDWRIIPTYGHARGYDSYIYHHSATEALVGELIDHMEAFKETDQFIWVSMGGGIHGIADCSSMPNSVQNHLDIKNCVIEECGPTSVKQIFSENKKVKYKKISKRIDALLGVVYQYIENNYDNEDVLVTLFADHGQGYLVPEGKHFCSEERSRVAFMFKGGNIESQLCNEVMSTSDYIKIMCSLADIEMEDIPIDGVLPKVFGGCGREYAISESIHPGDFYYAALYADDCVFYFENPYPIQDDGRFYLQEYKAELTDLLGRVLNDKKRYDNYLDIILKHIAPLCIYD